MEFDRTRTKVRIVQGPFIIFIVYKADSFHAFVVTLIFNIGLIIDVVMCWG